MSSQQRVKDKGTPDKGTRSRTRITQKSYMLGRDAHCFQLGPTQDCASNELRANKALVEQKIRDTQVEWEVLTFWMARKGRQGDEITIAWMEAALRLEKDKKHSHQTRRRFLLHPAAPRLPF